MMAYEPKTSAVVGIARAAVAGAAVQLAVHVLVRDRLCVLLAALVAVPIGMAAVALLLAVSVVVLHVLSTAIGHSTRGSMPTIGRLGRRM